MDATVIDRFAKASVLVVGDTLLDRFVEGRVARVSPEAPVPILRYGGARTCLGGAGNVAANLLAYGAAVTLVGVKGADAAAEELDQICARHPRLAADLAVDPARPTTVKTRYLSGFHQLLRVDAEDAGPLPEGVRAALLAAVERRLAAANVVVLSDYAKGVLEPATIGAVIAAARSHGRPVVIDPKKADAGVFAGATLLTPNVEEMAQLTGIRAGSDDAAEAACRALLDRVGVEAVLVTRGEAGMTLVRRAVPEPVHVRAEALRVFDVTGAGDTVIATIAAALASGLALPDAVRLANTAAGIVVAKPGTAQVSPHELRRALGLAGTADAAEVGEAAERAALWREEGLTVGFTNGCFDLLHRGHLHSLEQARRRCDRLIVGLNSDASTRRLKGPGRPVQEATTRAAVLAALRYVDLVVVFDADTPEAVIRAVRPNLLFKGADYQGRTVVGADFVEADGGRVELLPLLPGHSTTGTVTRMQGDPVRS